MISKLNNMKLKALLNENKIDEVKTELERSMFPVYPSGFWVLVQDNTFTNVNAKDIHQVLTTDLDNKQFLEEKQTQDYISKIQAGQPARRERINKNEIFVVKDYIRSAEFQNLKNSVETIIDFDTNDQILIKNNKKYINMAKPLPFNVETLENIKIEDYQQEIDNINKHILDVLVSGDGIQYNYFIKWLAHSVAGQKLRTALYIQSKERTGKGIFLNFINELLGERMLKTSSVETIHTYTKPLEGRCLINFDELPEEGKGKALSDRLKSLITEPLFDCRKMYENGYSQKNTFNIIITSNNNAVNLTASNNSRYVCCDVSDCKKGDTQYFKNLKKAMSKDGIHQAYYKYLISIFEESRGFDFDTKPRSKTRTEKLAISMPPLMRYIKEQHILKGYGLNVNCKAFIEHYNERAKHPISSIMAHKQMKEFLGIEKKRVYDKDTKKKDTCFIIEKQALYDLFVSKDWLIPEYEDVEEEDDDDEDVIDENDTVPDYESILKEKDDEIAKLKQMIMELQTKEPKVEVKRPKTRKELQATTGSIKIDFSF